MDILSDDEIRELIGRSELVRKYNEVIDRESAYELLNKKITDIQKEQAKIKEQEQRAKETQTQSRSTTSKRSSGQNPLLKMITSATFMRGVFGILTKVMKK